MKVNILIAGFQKCGTSALHSFLSEHPNIIGSNPKELDYFKQQLFKILDPVEIDGKAKRDQMLKIEAFGGEKEIKRKGTFQNTPLPNQQAKFMKR